MNYDGRNSKPQTGSMSSGLAVVGAFLAGVGGLLGSFTATVFGDFTGGGIFLLAATVAFGLLANAVFRH